MLDTLRHVIEADGGLEDWNKHKALSVDLVVGGMLWALAVAVEAQKRLDERAEEIREKTELLRANEVLLSEKDLLMREVHHRVRNSLQLVQTILILQARTCSDPEVREHLEQATARIMTIAAVHRRLYESGSVGSADAAQYLRGLLADMRGVLPDQVHERALELDMEPFELAADDLTPLGVIASELVTNALKHGRGRVVLAVRQLDGGLEVAVSDEGNGFPGSFDLEARGGLGMRLIAALAKRAEGDPIWVERGDRVGRIVVTTGFGGRVLAPSRRAAPDSGGPRADGPDLSWRLDSIQADWACTSPVRTASPCRT